MKIVISFYLILSFMIVSGCSLLEESLMGVNPPPKVKEKKEVVKKEKEPVSLDKIIEASAQRIFKNSTTTLGRVAIMDITPLESNDATGLSIYISNKVGNSLIMSGRQVVDRAALEKILKEQKLQTNALVDASTAAKIGKLAGASIFIIGNYSILSKKIVITLRALSVETSQFLTASEATVPWNRALQEDVAELHNKKINAPVQNFVIKKEPDVAIKPAVSLASSASSANQMPDFLLMEIWGHCHCRNSSFCFTPCKQRLGLS